jgi:hypothetical protein
MADKVSVSQNIDASADVIYKLVSDLPRMGDWSTESTGGRWLAASGPTVGGRFLGRNRNGGRQWSTLATVTAAHPGRRFAFRVSAPFVPISRWEFQIHQAAAGCRVEQTWIDRRPLVIRLISTVRTGVADRAGYNRRSTEQTLLRVKAEAEATARRTSGARGD